MNAEEFVNVISLYYGLDEFSHHIISLPRSSRFLDARTIILDVILPSSLEFGHAIAFWDAILSRSPGSILFPALRYCLVRNQQDFIELLFLSISRRPIVTIYQTAIFFYYYTIFCLENPKICLYMDKLKMKEYKRHKHPCHDPTGGAEITQVYSPPSDTSWLSQHRHPLKEFQLSEIKRGVD
jgi:hypothetical protein